RFRRKMPASTGVQGRKGISQRGVIPPHCARVFVAFARCLAAVSATVARPLAMRSIPFWGCHENLEMTAPKRLLHRTQAVPRLSQNFATIVRSDHCNGSPKDKNGNFPIFARMKFPAANWTSLTVDM